MFIYICTSTACGSNIQNNWGMKRCSLKPCQQVICFSTYLNNAQFNKTSCQLTLSFTSSWNKFFSVATLFRSDGGERTGALKCVVSSVCAQTRWGTVGWALPSGFFHPACCLCYENDRRRLENVFCGWTCLFLQQWICNYLPGDTEVWWTSVRVLNRVNSSTFGKGRYLCWRLKSLF